VAVSDELTVAVPTEASEVADPDRSALRRVTAAGTISSIAIAVGVTKAGTVMTAIQPDGPLALWRPDFEHPLSWSVLALLGITGLALAFLGLYRITRAGQADVRSVAFTALCWSVPMLITPPVLSLDVWSYLAQGTMVRRGIDPYLFGPSMLGPGPVLDAVSPVWRDTPAPYGPLMLGGLWLLAIVSAGHLSLAAFALRGVVVVAVLVASVLVVRMAPPERKALALALVAANPLVVIHLVGGAHLDAILAALAAVTIWSVRRQWFVVAALAAATAFAIKLPGMLLIGYLLAHLIRGPHPLGQRALTVAGYGALMLGAVVGYGLLVPDGWGWVGAMNVPGMVRIYWAPASIVGGLLYALSSLVGAPYTFSEVLDAARSVTSAAGAITIAALLWRAGAEPSWRRAGALVGAALLTLAISAPVMHAWYVAWGGVLLAACAGPVSRRWAVVLGAALCFSAVPDQLGGTAWSLLAVPMCLLIVVADAVRTVVPSVGSWFVRTAPA
jgi:hypothetical protein